MTINIGIPQIIWLVMAIFGLIYEIINHDKPREPHNAYTFAISVVISFLLLYWGGFFGQEDKMGKIEEAIFCVFFVILLPFVLAVVVPTAAYVYERINERLRNN